MTHHNTNGEKESLALSVKMAKYALELLPSQERLSLAVQTIRLAGFRVNYLVGLDRLSFRKVQDIERMTVFPHFELPKWEDIDRKGADKRELTALACFVYDQEPSGKEAQPFRNQLNCVVTEAYQLGYLEAIKVLQKGNNP